MSKFITEDGREYPIAFMDITMKESRLLQEVTGQKWKDLLADLYNEGPDGKAAFLWLAMRKNGHHVSFADLDFSMAKLKLELDEVDPTEASPATPKESTSSPTRARSKSGPRSKPS